MQRYDTSFSLSSSAWVEEVSAEEVETVAQQTGVLNEEEEEEEEKEEEVTPADSDSGVSGDCPGAHLFITAPQKIQALTGSCVWISCSFEPVTTEETLSGVWIKNKLQFGQNPNNVIFNSTNKKNIYSGEIRGNLKEQNCSTVFYNVQTNFTDKYFFRIESKSFKATASCNSVYINVTDSPPSPTLEIPPDLKENESVTLTCSAPTPCPGSAPRLTWHLQQDPPNEMKKNSDGTFTTRIKRTFILSDRDDGRSVGCSAVYPVNEGQERTVEKIVSLSVSYAPKDTVVSISRSEGHQVNMTCSSRAKPSVSRFSWYKKNLDRDVEVAEGADLSVTFTDGDVYFCEAFNAVGQQRSAEIQLTESLPWEQIGRGIIGFMVLVWVVAVYVWHYKSTRPTVQQTQSPAGGDEIELHSLEGNDGENKNLPAIN
ncbi:B-cell receptor CD22-like isoform X2 [Solea solea]|uniref:B-cell receptor CD22-like isoform X2 n=1 Tax=Solea solea TaxID=90069 RepID=UPI00272C25FD|nr:B-cell receptor CD22-like isoform X2 [Solea solea]